MCTCTLDDSAALGLRCGKSREKEGAENDPVSTKAHMNPRRQRKYNRSGEGGLLSVAQGCFHEPSLLGLIFA